MSWPIRFIRSRDPSISQMLEVCLDNVVYYEHTHLSWVRNLGLGN